MERIFGFVFQKNHTVFINYFIKNTFYLCSMPVPLKKKKSIKQNRKKENKNHSVGFFFIECLI